MPPKKLDRPKWADLGLPLPRLQLTWEELEKRDADGYNWICRYELILPLPKYDIRNDGKDGKVGKGPGYYTADLGGTRTTREGGPNRYGTLDTPFRDGAHIAWDSVTLNLPAFVVWGDIYRRLDEPSRQWPAPQKAASHG